jgi:N-acetylglucosaminyl-diphospho-decaprenol L-rhamnosyltransferase
MRASLLIDDSCQFIDPMKLSIIIVNWNTCDLLVQCLDSVFHSSPESGLEVIVVDNASDDDSVATVSGKFPSVKLIQNQENLGFARANNLAIPACQGEYILLLNSDTVVPTGALSMMIDTLDVHPKVGAVGPKLTNLDGSFQASYANFPSLSSEFLLVTGLSRWVIGKYAPSPDPMPGEEPRPVDWVAGAALMVRKLAIDQIGLMNESYFFYSEETEWCWRLWKARWEVWYLPQVEITHLGGGSSRLRALESYKNLYASKIRFFSDVYGFQDARRLQVLLLATGAFKVLLWWLLSLFSSPFRMGAYVKVRLQRDLTLTRLQFGKFVRKEI